MKLTDNRAARWVPLAVTAALPFATVYCTRASSPPDAPVAVAIASDVAVPAVAATDASPPPPDTIVTAPSSAPLPTVAKATRKQCEAIQAKVSALIAAGKGCTSDVDCDNVYTGCGLEGVCGAAIAKANEPAVKKASSDFWDQGCMYAMPPLPCPTCAMPPPPRCKGGKCQ